MPSDGKKKKKIILGKVRSYVLVDRHLGKLIKKKKYFFSRQTFFFKLIF